MLLQASSMVHNVNEVVLCSQIATKDDLECLEYLAVLQVPFIKSQPIRPFLCKVLIAIRYLGASLCFYISSEHEMWNSQFGF